MKGQSKYESNICECLNVVTTVIRQWLLYFVVGTRSYIQNFHSSIYSEQYDDCTVL